MMTLTNHSCYHCQHMHRQNRTVHGQMTEAVRKAQKELQEALDTGNLNMVQWKRSVVEERIQWLQQFERLNGTMETWYNRKHK